MAPTNLFPLVSRDFNTTTPAIQFKAEWTAPSNYAFTILLLLGGDVVSRALAQLAGGRITPVAFSFGMTPTSMNVVHACGPGSVSTTKRLAEFSHPITPHHVEPSVKSANTSGFPGWVAYATSAINSAIGENKLMPGADTPCTVINADNGQTRSNGSWILGRMMRDFEFWMDADVEDKVQLLREQKWKFDKERAEREGQDPSQVPRPGHAGLVVSVWEVDSTKSKRLGKPGRDILFWSGIVTYILQLGIAAIPFGIYGNWGVFLVTGAAIILCLLTGTQYQWRREKWACRQVEPGKKRTYIMTRGNGAQHAIVILCNGCGLNLEDLCTGFDNLDSPSISISTRLFMVVLGMLWVLLLITSSALTDRAWFLIAVGGMGMLQNMFVAGWSRRPEALGLPLKYIKVLGSPKVFQTILDVEAAYPKVGRNLVPTFFPAGLRDKEENDLQAIEAEAKAATIKG